MTKQNFPVFFGAMVPRLTSLLLAVALLALGAGAFYSLRLDPEISYWAAAAERKLDWVHQMRQQHGYVIGVVGGSTTTFGIDAEHIHKEHNLPVANLGLHAGMGPDVCVGLGFAALQGGDTLILSLEPGMLAKDDSTTGTRLGRKLALRLRRPELMDWRKDSSYSVASTPSQLQPGGYHFMTMLGKLALRRPLYRYSIDDLLPGGLQTTTERRSVANSNDLGPEQSANLLSTAGQTFLRDAQREAARRGINLLYILPWTYVPSDISANRRRNNMELLNEVHQFVSVLYEPELGVHVVEEDFADSGQHLTAYAAQRRSAQLAKTLKLADYERN